MSEQKPSLTYRDAGVDIDAGNELVNRIKNTAARTRRPEVLGGLGGFGAMVSIPAGYKEPVLVSGTEDRKSTRLNSSHVRISYAVFCLKKKKKQYISQCNNITYDVIMVRWTE